MGQKVKFEKTTVQTIEAIQFDGNNYQEVLDWVKMDRAHFRLHSSGVRLHLDTNSLYSIAKGDWVMRCKGKTEAVTDDVIQQFSHGYNNWKIVPVMPTFEPPKEEAEKESAEQKREEA